MGKVVIGAVTVLLLSTASCYRLDVEDSPVTALVFPAPVTPTPSYVPVIGTPAAVTLPDVELDDWFSDDPAADPLAVPTWQGIADFVAAAQTPAGWTDACKKAADGAGSDRTGKPLLGALGCSDDASVTAVQRFALLILDARAHTALWMRGVPGYNTAGISGRLAEIRAACTTEVAARDAADGTPFASACALALNDAYRSGDGTSTFEALGQAYEAVAAEIARRDPTVDDEPGLYPSATATP